MTTGIARFLSVAGVVFGVSGTAIYIVDTWVRGDGQIETPSGLSGTALAIGLILVSIGIRLFMRDASRRR